MDEPPSEVGMEILLYFTSTKDARYEIIAGTQSREFVERKRAHGHVPAEMCKARAPDKAVWVKTFPIDVSSGT